MKKFLTVTALVLSIFFAFSNPAIGQEFSFQTYITSNDLITQTCTFGLKEQALPGLDQFDIPSPPPTPGNALHTHLEMMAPPETIPNQWIADFRPMESAAMGMTEFWILELSHDFPGSTATIFINQTTLLPEPFELWLHQPNAASEQVTIPGTIEISLDSSAMVFFWELRREDSVTTNISTWGGIKSLYR